MKHRSALGGATLVEVLIYSAISLLLLLTLLTYFKVTSQNYDSVSKETRTAQVAKTLKNSLNRDLMRSETGLVEIGPDSQSVSIELASGYGPEGKLSLSGEKACYALESGAVYRWIGEIDQRPKGRSRVWNQVEVFKLTKTAGTVELELALSLIGSSQREGRSYRTIGKFLAMGQREL